MSFWNKSKQETAVRPEDQKSLYPVLHVMGSLKEYHTELVQKEVDSLRELNNIGSSFGGVMEEAGNFQSKLEDFGEHFASIEDVSRRRRLPSLWSMHRTKSRSLKTVRGKSRHILARWEALSRICRRQ